ncbi:hypothetical protein HU200_009183 [Digitaria exilis]|uniref:Uncharacterized protein n=1 Tax=Digitaria exilis TaxID=1010633 RepID=A0A835FK72_9POAL|nr:hypothetical protein HU200_009183 [Digitaria exilis]
MWRGANNGVRVVVDGEVHVERVEKIEAVAVDGVPSPPPMTTAAARVVLPPPGKAAAPDVNELAANSGDGKAVRDINEIAADFIRRSKKKFQGSGATTKYGQKVIT